MNCRRTFFAALAAFSGLIVLAGCANKPKPMTTDELLACDPRFSVKPLPPPYVKDLPDGAIFYAMLYADEQGHLSVCDTCESNSRPYLDGVAGRFRKVHNGALIDCSVPTKAHTMHGDQGLPILGTFKEPKP